MDVTFKLNNRLPPLAWCAAISEGRANFIYGKQVQVFPTGVFEGGWSHTKTPENADPAGIYVGSGAFLTDGRLVAIAPHQTCDRVFVVMRDQKKWVSNSMAFALASAGIANHKVAKSVAAYSSVVKGLDVYKRNLFTSEEYEVFGFTTSVVDIDALKETRHVPEYDFSTFEQYKDFLLRVIKSVAQTAGTTDMTAYLSRGYDSVACAALMAHLGGGDCLTVSKGRAGIDDGGHEIASALGLPIHDIVPKERRIYVGKNGLNFTEIGEEDADDIRLFSVGTNYADLPLKAPESFLAGRLVLTGFHGDKIWDKNTEPSADVKRGDPSGGGLYEYRLRAGFVNLAVPFMGALRHASLWRISTSKEMAPWSVGTRYDRPIPRRLAEEMNVPRETFGNKKSAISTQTAIDQEFRNRLFSQIVADYRTICNL